jgi:CMP-2-keto-3-deoxyoctulosonic acid synthetase
MLEQLRALEAGMIIHVAIVATDSPAVDVPSDIDHVLARLHSS